MIYRRDAKKGEATYSPKSHSAPHFEGHYVDSITHPETKVFKIALK